MYTNYANYNTFTGNVHNAIPVNWDSYISDPHEPNFVVKKNKLVLLDFYTTNCGVCFEKFPSVQHTYERHKNDSSLAVFTVNIPVGTDTPGLAETVVRRQSCSFPVLIGKPGATQIFGISRYPTTLLIKNNVIIFKGDIEDAEKRIAAETCQ